MDEVFETSRAATKTAADFVPTVDIRETDTNYFLDITIPGIKKEELAIELKDNKLTVSGERKRNEDETAGKYRLAQTRYGKFSRSFNLSNDVKRDAIDASLSDGILTITLVKSEDTASRSIEIK